MKVIRMTLISNAITFGPRPKANQEVEQRLTINAAGRVWFSSYNIDKKLMRREYRTIGKEQAEKIFVTFGNYLNDYFPHEAMDVGDWELMFTYDNGKVAIYSGPLTNDYKTDRINLTTLLRRNIAIKNLFGFDNGF